MPATRVPAAAKYLSVRDACLICRADPTARNSVRRWMPKAVTESAFARRSLVKALTTAEWCDEFFTAMTGLAELPVGEHHEAEAALDRLGIRLDKETQQPRIVLGICGTAPG